MPSHLVLNLSALLALLPACFAVQARAGARRAVLVDPGARGRGAGLRRAGA